MNYIKQIRAFYASLITVSLSSNAQALYNFLLSVNNSIYWKENFTMPNLIIKTYLNVNISALTRARNELIENGFIRYEKGKRNDAGIYEIIKLYSDEDENNEYKKETKLQQSCDDDATNLQQSCNDDATNVNTYNKQNKTKENEINKIIYTKKEKSNFYAKEKKPIMKKGPLNNFKGPDIDFDAIEKALMKKQQESCYKKSYDKYMLKPDGKNNQANQGFPSLSEFVQSGEDTC